MHLAQSTFPVMLADRLAEVRERIERACARAGRAASDVTLIGVSKTYPVEMIREAVAAGLTHFGENRVQELAPKADILPGIISGGEITWHMIGHLQRNKTRDVIRYADVFHALDSVRLGEELDRRAEQEGRALPCLVQVNVSGEGTKSGVPPAEILELLARLVAFPHLQLCGLMAIAEPVENAELVRPQFRVLRELFERHRPEGDRAAYWTRLSMGMSGDFEVAIEEGATYVRIGSAIFGERT